MTNNQKLAELLFPNVAHDVDYYLNKFKKRDLPAGAEVTRIAPSPTGFLHLGTVYGALIDYLAAKKTNGVFYTRLEDTDQKREIKEAGQIAYDMLCYYGLKPDEGYRGDNNSQLGEYGSYIQSERKDIYHAFAKKLVELGRAFPCFCEKSETKQDIIERRNEQLESTEDIEAKDPCRSLTYEQIKANIGAGKPFALRLLSIGDADKTFEFEDKIKGKRTIRENTKDIVLLKSDGIPVYSLAHLVDDTLMGTTTVVRGEEWYPSLASHIELFDAMGLPRMNYAHTPVICKLDEEGNKRKLSKRKDPEADSRYFAEHGYPINAVIEYLLNLLNSDFEMWRANNPQEDYHNFDFKFSKISSNNPMFDMVKLNDVSKNLISRMKAVDVYNQTVAWAKNKDSEFAKILEDNKELAISALNIDREIERPRKDITTYSEVKSLYSYFFNETFNKSELLNFDEKYKKVNITNFLSAYKSKIDLTVAKDVWFAGVKEVAGECGFAIDNKAYKANPSAYAGNVADACTILRVALTGRTQTPDLYSIMQVLGIDEVQSRINYVLTNLK